jgi:hypothetical protein
VSDAPASVVNVLPSRLRRDWLRGAAAGCAMIALALAIGSLQAQAWPAAAASLACLLCAVAALRQARREPAIGSLRILGRADLQLRPPADAAAPHSTSRWLSVVPWSVTTGRIVLRGQSRDVVLWRDAIGADAFRRIAAIARWHPRART